MQLLQESWATWWHGPAAETQNLQDLVQKLKIHGPPDWQWNPTLDQLDEVIRRSPTTSPGCDDEPYSAWKALRKGAERRGDGMPSWIVFYLYNTIEGLASCQPGEVPSDFNDLLCHVLGKTPKQRTTTGELIRGAQETRIIEVGSVENRLIGRTLKKRFPVSC